MTDLPSRSLLARYSLDSSFFIDLWSEEGEFSRDVFAGVWDALEDGVKQGSIVAPEVVRDELSDTEDADLKTWPAVNGAMFVPLDMGQIGLLTEIVRNFPKYAKEARNLADPAVIALARCDDLTVLTSEKWVPQHSKEKPKIPNVCETYDVKCLNILRWCREENITVVRS